MKTLIVVDMQKDFINGSLGTREAEAIVENVKEKIAEYRANGDEIIFTRDTHQQNYLETNEGKHLPVVHCIEGSEGWQIDARLDTTGCEIINKPALAHHVDRLIFWDLVQPWLKSSTGILVMPSTWPLAYSSGVLTSRSVASAHPAMLSPIFAGLI